MNRSRLMVVVPALGLGLLAALFGFQSASAGRAAATPTTIAVMAGKPSELA
jgi:hypothetical protein